MRAKSVNKHVQVLLLFIASFLAMLIPQDAFACGNEFYAEREYARQMKKAERFLAKVKHKEAALSSIRAFLLSVDSQGEGDFEASDQATFVVATALMRIPAKKITRRFLKKVRRVVFYNFDPVVRKIEIHPQLKDFDYGGVYFERKKFDVPMLKRWAHARILERYKNSPSPKSKARYAESLLRKGEATEKAHRLLVSLENRDLLPDAWAYRALAVAYERIGKKEESLKVIENCKKKAGFRKKKICLGKFE